MPANTTALLILLATLALLFLAMAIVAVLAYRARLREADEETYFAPHGDPEIIRNPEDTARYLDGQGWPV